MQRIAIAALIVLSSCGLAAAQNATPAARPPELLALYDRGVALVEQHRHGEAVPLFDQVLAAAPDWTEARINLGIALLNQQKDFQRAEQELTRALQADPANPWAHYTLAMLYRHLGDPQKAAEHLDAVLRADPASADTHAALGALLAADGKLAEAEGHFRKAMELNPYLIPAHYGLGRTLLQEG